MTKEPSSVDWVQHQSKNGQVSDIEGKMILDQPIECDLMDLQNVVSWAESLYTDLLRPIEHYRRLNDPPAPPKKFKRQKSMWFGHSPRWKLTVSIVNRRNGDGSIGKYPTVTYLPED